MFGQCTINTYAMHSLGEVSTNQLISQKHTQWETIDCSFKFCSTVGALHHRVALGNASNATHFARMAKTCISHSVWPKETCIIRMLYTLVNKCVCMRVSSYPKSILFDAAMKRLRGFGFGAKLILNAYIYVVEPGIVAQSIGIAHMMDLNVACRRFRWVSILVSSAHSPAFEKEPTHKHMGTPHVRQWMRVVRFEYVFRTWAPVRVVQPENRPDFRPKQNCTTSCASKRRTYRA